VAVGAVAVDKDFDYGPVEGAGAAPMWPRVVRRAYGVVVRDKALVIEFGRAICAFR
jgi:hypothetical protein